MNQYRRLRDESSEEQCALELEQGHARKQPRRSNNAKETLVSIEQLLQKLSEPNGESCLTELSCEVNGLLPRHKMEILRLLVQSLQLHPMQCGAYATFVGLLNVCDFEFGADCLSCLRQQLWQALEAGEWQQARNLLLLLAELVNANVLTASSMLQLLNALLDAAQHDCYAWLVLSSLPLLARELYEKLESGLQALLKRLSVYMKQRCSGVQLQLLRIWTLSERAQHDYLELLWQQVLQLQGQHWMLQQLRRPYTNFDGTLSSALQHQLTERPAVAATRQLRYARAHLVARLFAPADLPLSQQLPAELHFERHLIDCHILEILQSQHLERKRCAALLCAYSAAHPQLALPHCIVELLLLQMLQLPAAPYPTINYGVILIELCKLQPHSFPHIIVQAVDLIFAQLPSMSVACFDRFVDWFSHHLSNFRYQWNWLDWQQCIHFHQLHPCAMFVRELLKKCMRLSYHQHVVQMMPAAFAPLLPVAPVPDFKYIDERLPGAQLAKQLLDVIRSKCTVEVVGGLLEAATELPEELKINVLMQTLLHLGCKSFTHVFCLFTKFHAVLKLLAAGNELNQLAMLQAIFELWTNNEQLKTVLAERLMKMRLIKPNIVVRFVFSSALKPELSKLYLWELLNVSIRYTKQHLQGSEQQLTEQLECLLLGIVQHAAVALAKQQAVAAPAETDYWSHWVLGRLQGILFAHVELVRPFGDKLNKIVSDFEHCKRLLKMIENYLAYIK
ncbi:CG7907 [Drosophila busckii]|uniref:Nuclear cap-binding protein subunit 1 n=1 Tax=Drosophila busckii TaxID=30019 RepID=A0A0M4E2J4_DROBS|nr:nuclear cap-binding protein subunit 1 [Drosophila busckii]ALC39841.1 CG7907 [Drosophila busckii]